MIWLRIFADLIPFMISAALILLGTYIPALMRGGAWLYLYMAAVIVFAVSFHLIWVAS